MRILHLDSGKEMRGGQWQVFRLMEGLRREGVECMLLARRASPLFEMARKAGMATEGLSLARLASLARKYDLIHAHDAHSHSMGALIPGARFIVARRVGFAIGSRWKYARAVHYVAVSEYVKGVLMAGEVPERKISVVGDGVPLLEPARGDALLAPASHEDPQKGAALALEAARIAGVSLKFSDHLERDLSGAGMFLYITHSEGLGSAALLAMSAAVPVIASDVGGLREVIRHRENGLLVENSATTIAATIQELRSNPEMARRFGCAARQTIQERFTIDFMVSRTLAVYRSVLS